MSGPVYDFYNGSKVLITGGSGFVGKLLTENLLRKTQVDKIYLLVRSRKGEPINERAKEIINNEVFSILKRDKPDSLSKIQLISGDITKEGLNLSENDKNILIENVNIVFHAAATVNFNENLKDAVQINLLGTEKMLQLAQEIKNLKVFIHISTAFSNCDKKQIREQIYEFDDYDLKQLSNSINRDLAEKITPIILGNAPNTYVHTKKAAELLVKNSKLPVGIFRPAIITGSSNEPLEGYIDNKYGPTGVAISIMTGLMHVVMIDANALADMVPVDKVINGIIVSAVDSHNRFIEGKEMPVYNYVSSPVRPIKWGQFIEKMSSEAVRNPTIKKKWHSFAFLTTSWHHYYFLAFIMQIIPAFLIDKLGKKAKLLRIYKNLDSLFYVLEPFSTNSWLFEYENIPRLWHGMTPDEKINFNFNLREIHWDQYLETYVEGIKKYIFKENDTELKAKRKSLRLKCLHFLLLAAITTILAALLALFMYRNSES